MVWRNFRPLAWAGMAAVALGASSPVWADRDGRGHGHRGGARVGIGLYLGPGYLGPGFGYPMYRPAYPYPYYYPEPYPAPAVIAVPTEPPVYIERGNDGTGYNRGADGQPPQGYWYRCNQPNGYYPYVSQCPGGWLQVPAQPPAN